MANKMLFRLKFGLPVVSNYPKDVTEGEKLIDELGNVYIMSAGIPELIVHHKAILVAEDDYRALIQNMYGDIDAFPWRERLGFLQRHANFRLFVSLVNNEATKTYRERIGKWI